MKVHVGWANPVNRQPGLPRSYPRTTPVLCGLKQSRAAW